MSSSFAFVPRTLSKDKKKPGRNVHLNRSIPSLSAPTPTPTVNDRGKGKASDGKSKYSDEDYANVICIAISDYALWSDPDLRRTIDWSTRSESGQQANDAFIPLSYLLDSSKFVAPLRLQGSQTLIVKALRSYASDVVDVRLLVSEPSSSSWFGNSSAGGYEIRRKDWADNAPGCFGELSKVDWEKQTIYVENIPLQHRTIPGIARFILSLLSANDASALIRIQGIALPPHHQDRPGDHPTCKGFALVILQNHSDVEFLLHRWPWDRTLVTQNKTDASPSSLDGVEAFKFGFRTLPKTRWDELREEYLAYRKELVEEINAFEDAEVVMQASSTSSGAQKPPQAPLSKDVLQVNAPTISLSSPYPVNSLVFVRNIHPETNKTTLRKLLGTAFVASLAKGMVPGDGVDYVDFNKGMDSCYIRLSTPNHAQHLIEHFLANPVSQSSGLDDTGTAIGAKSNSIAVELVAGKREEFYWEKVPEKVRRQAVEKAVSLMRPSPPVKIPDDGGGEERKRKRQKH